MIDWIINGGWIIVCSVCGMVMIFQEPLPKPRPAKSPKRKSKPAKRKGQKMSKKAKPEKQKAWYVAPPMSAAQHAEYAKYYAKSRGAKMGEWENGFVPR